MSLGSKLKHELKAVAIAALYFGCWFAVMLVIKSLILAEYHVQFRHYSMALVGALILSKVVIIMEKVPLGSWVATKPAWVDVLLRTGLYAVGVVAVLAVEKGIEGRHDAGGFGPAVWSALRGTSLSHLWINTICVSGALLFYNVSMVVRRHLGPRGLLGLMSSPLPPAITHKS